jgi:hypothetical protein
VFGHILRRNCLLKQVIEGKIKGEMEVTRRGGRRSRKLLDDLKDRRGYSHLKEEALDRTMWRNSVGGELWLRMSIAVRIHSLGRDSFFTVRQVSACLLTICVTTDTLMTSYGLQCVSGIF